MRVHISFHGEDPSVGGYGLDVPLEDIAQIAFDMSQSKDYIYKNMTTGDVAEVCGVPLLYTEHGWARISRQEFELFMSLMQVEKHRVAGASKTLELVRSLLDE